MFLRSINKIMILCLGASLVSLNYANSHKRSADSSWEQGAEKRLRSSEKIIIYCNDGFMLGDETLLFLCPAIINQLQQGTFVGFNIASDDLILAEQLLTLLEEKIGYINLKHGINNFNQIILQEWRSYLGRWLVTIDPARLLSMENAFSMLQLHSLQMFMSDIRSDTAQLWVDFFFDVVD